MKKNKMHLFILTIVISFLSLSIFSFKDFSQNTSKIVVEYTEKKNKADIEIEDFSHFTLYKKFINSQAQFNFIYIDKIYNLHFSNNLLRPPIFS